MKIKVQAIPEEGFTLTENIDPANWKLETPELKFIEPVRIAAVFQKQHDSVFVQVTAQAEQELICDRCATSYKASYQESFDLDYLIKETPVLDISDDVRQEIILDYPIRFLCKENCLGLCAHCGKNLNEGPCSCVPSTSRGVSHAVT